MLRLDRKPDETILIGEGITVTVLEIRTRRGDPRARPGIEAPQDVPVDRPEITVKCLPIWAVMCRR